MVHYDVIIPMEIDEDTKINININPSWTFNDNHTQPYFEHDETYG